MAYTNNTPQGNQTISATQPLIESNFSYIGTEQRVNHTWTDNSGSNAISGEADGSHQKLNFPNQGTDIVGALPPGIAAIQYAIGNALFAWDGTNKQAVSGIVKSATGITLTTTYQTIATLPNNCIGLLMIIQPGQASLMCFPFVSGNFGLGDFVTVMSNGYFTSPTYKAQGSGLNLQIGTQTLATQNLVSWKLIYWPL